MNNRSALAQYKSVEVQSSIEGASPHTLIGKLLDGALDRIAAAKGAIERDDASLKGEKISGAIAIVDSLRASLDFARGGEISTNLASLYDYAEARMLTANTENSVQRLEEAAVVLKEIRAGWQGIAAEVGAH